MTFRCFDVVHRYELGSGSKLNLQKTCGVFLGRWKGRKSGPVDIRWSDSVKIVGIYFGYGDIDRIIWNEKIVNLQHAIDYWNSVRNVSLKGRVYIANVFLFAKLWYVAEIVPPSRVIVKKLTG